MARLDELMERGLDNLIFEKYQKLTESQAFEVVTQRIAEANKAQLEHD